MKQLVSKKIYNKHETKKLSTHKVCEVLKRE